MTPRKFHHLEAKFGGKPGDAVVTIDGTVFPCTAFSFEYDRQKDVVPLVTMSFYATVDLETENAEVVQKSEATLTRADIQGWAHYLTQLADRHENGTLGDQDFAVKAQKTIEDVTSRMENAGEDSKKEFEAEEGKALKDAISRALGRLVVVLQNLQGEAKAL